MSNTQANEQVTPFEAYNQEPNPINELSASISDAKNSQQENNIQQQPIETEAKSVEPEAKPAEPKEEVKTEEPEAVKNTEAKPADPKPEPTETKKEDKPTNPTNEMEFDEALEQLEKELGIKTSGEEIDTDSKDDEVSKSLDREQKFLKIIKELDSTNRNTLKKAGELEVELDKAQTQAALYKKQAHEYYEELRANEFDRSKFQVDDKAKNFVHYFNEYAKDSKNVQARDWALREAVKIVSSITWRDLSRYLVDYFSMWSADLSEFSGWWKIPQTFNKSPNRAENAESAKVSKLGDVLAEM